MMHWAEYYLVAGAAMMLAALSEALYGDWGGVMERPLLAFFVCVWIVALWPLFLLYLIARALDKRSPR